MWPFKKGWSAKQKRHRQLCRQEEKEMERMINWMEMNMTPVRRQAARKAQERLYEVVASRVAPDPDAPNGEASTGLPEALAHEFDNNADPKGDACCVRYDQ